MYEAYYDKLKPYFGQGNLHLHFMDTDSLVLSINTKNIIKDLKSLEDIFDFANLDKIMNYSVTKTKKYVVNFKIETPKNIWVDEFVCLRSKMYAFKSGDDSKNKLKGVSKSQSKIIIFEDYYNCLFGGNYQQECDNYPIRSYNQEKYLQRVRKSTLPLIDDKRCYINETENKPFTY